MWVLGSLLPSGSCKTAKYCTTTAALTAVALAIHLVQFLVRTTLGCIDLLAESSAAVRVMPQHTICGLGDTSDTKSLKETDADCQTHD